MDGKAGSLYPPLPVTQSTAPSAWHASLSLQFHRKGKRTVMDGAEHRGPLRVQRPFYPEGGLCHVYLLHPPGGLVGGDELQIDIDVAAEAEALLTTPAAAKFYRSTGRPAKQAQRICLGADARCEWLPQENIMFDGARSVLTTEVELAPGARFIGWETTCLGRPAARAPYHNGCHDQRFALCRERRLFYLERLKLNGDGDARHAVWGLMGYEVSSLLLATPADDHALTTARSAIRDYNGGVCACTLIEDVLLCRCLSRCMQDTRRLMTALWHCLRPLILDREACTPRIWLT